MTVPVTIGNATLYLGDAREIVRAVGLVDAVVTNPPYGIGKAGWDCAYPNWIEDESFRIARAVCIMPGMWAIPKCVAAMGNRYKSIISGRNINGMTFGPIGFNNWIPAVCGGDIPHKGQDAFEFSVGSEPKPEHESPKPLAYMLKLIDRVTERDWSILDPFMGSGTTGVACAKLGRKFVGIEIEERYFQIACRRIEQAYAQPDMFVEQPATAEQLSFDPYADNWPHAAENSLASCDLALAAIRRQKEGK